MYTSSRYKDLCLDHISLVLDLMRAVKLNNSELYAYCLDSMCGLFFSYGGHNYARYLTFFSMFIVNIEFSHPGAMEQLRLGVISVARSMIPGSRCAVDKTMEETFMKNAKSRGGAGGTGTGITGLTQNISAYERWVRTMHERCKYVDWTNNMAGLNKHDSSCQHRENRMSEKKRSEKQV